MGGMSAPLPPSTRLLSGMARVKGWVLLMFFGGGGLLTAFGLALPPQLWDGAAPGVGRALLLVSVASGVAALGALWFSLRAAPRRFDVLFMLLSNACILPGAVGETLLFGTQMSAMTALWGMVFAAGFLSRRLALWQVAIGSVSMGVMVYVRARYVTDSALWLVELPTTVLPVTLTALAVAYFRSAAEEEARELARVVRTDPLTGLGNRRALFEGLVPLLEGLRPGARPALVMLDIDHFKRVNDQFGHQEGDGVIRALADVLLAHARPSDLTIRHGGEEFVWVTADEDPQALLERVESLRRAFASRMDARGVTVSAGVAHWPADLPVQAAPGDHAVTTELLNRADEALYRAKAGGRNQVQVTLPGRSPGSGLRRTAVVAG